MLSHHEYSTELHRVSHEAAEETNVILTHGYVHCYHRTNGVEEKWWRSSPTSTWWKNNKMMGNPDLDDEGLAHLIGQKIIGVDMDEDTLKFHIPSWTYVYKVYGDCCSHSYFHDMHGKEKLLENGPVVSVKRINLQPVSSECDDVYTQAYGFEIVTEDPRWGEQTTTFSFRNDSNGYYGGEMVLKEIQPR